MQRIDHRAVPSNTSEVRMFVVGVDAATLLPHVLEHHFSIGVDRVFYIDNGSTDDSLETLLSYTNVHVWAQPAPFTSRAKTDWTMQLIHQFGAGCWCLVVDTDELFVYPDYENTSLHQFIASLESQGFDCVATRFIDMYGKSSIKDVRVDRSLIDAMPYFDVSEYGVRERVLGFRPEIGKTPLFRYQSDIIPALCFHRISGYSKLSDTYCALLHFKFHAEYEVTYLRHVQKMADAEQKLAAYSNLAIRSLYDEDVSVLYTGSRDLERFETTWSGDVWQRHLKLCRQERDFSHLIHSVKKMHGDRQNCFVIVGCYNELDLTKALLDSLILHQDEQFNYIYFFVDDASPELETLEFFQQNIHEIELNIVFGRHIRNRKLTAIWNYGINFALTNTTPHYFLLLNNDIVVSEGWASRLMEFASRHNDECAVGPITNHCNTRGGKQSLSTYLPHVKDVDPTAVEPISKQVVDIPSVQLEEGDFLSGFCLLIPAKVLREGSLERDEGQVNYFDPQRPHYGNELEFFARFSFPQYVLPSVFVYHKGEASIRTFRSGFDFFYTPDGRINRELVMLVINYFWAEDDARDSTHCLEKLKAYLEEFPCEGLLDLVQANSTELNAEVRIVRRQIRFEDAVVEP